jgi:hypothetical protein
MSSLTHAQNAEEYLGVLPPPVDWTDKCYQTVIRRFKTGEVEVTTHLVRPMQRLAQAERWAQGYPIRISSKSDDDLNQVTTGKQEQKKKDNLKRAVRRARQHVRWHVKSIAADHLLTLTYRTVDDAPMDDIECLKEDWQRFVRLVRKGLPSSVKHRSHCGLKEWKFVAVREIQDNGSFHLHVAVVGRQDINYIRRCWYVAIGGNQDDEGDITKGQINVRGPSKRWGAKTFEWRSDKLSGYMTKYLHKAFEEFESDGSKRYWASKSNDKVEPVRIWLAASSFVDAIQETYTIATRLVGDQWCSLWASNSYDAVWAAGPAPLP